MWFLFRTVSPEATEVKGGEIVGSSETGADSFQGLFRAGPLVFEGCSGQGPIVSGAETRKEQAIFGRYGAGADGLRKLPPVNTKYAGPPPTTCRRDATGPSGLIFTRVRQLAFAKATSLVLKA